MSENEIPENEIDEASEQKPKNLKIEKRKAKPGVPPIIYVLSLLAVATTAFSAAWIVSSKTYSNKINDILSDRSETVTLVEGKLMQMDSLLENEFLFDMDSEKIADNVMKGYMYGLGDKYAEYYTADEYKMLTDQQAGSMEGIGVTVYYDAEEGGLRVAEVVKDSPAEKAGVKVNDLIAYVVEGEEYYSVSGLGYTMAVSKLRGEAGTKAEFIIYREEEEYAVPHEMSVERQHITTSTVVGHIHCADKTVGVINIKSFDDNTADEFIKMVEDLMKEGAEKFIFDVRSNPGGELFSIGKVLDYLLPEGPVARTVDKNGNEEVVYTSDENELDVPMIVVCNGNTASAGELFCAALRDYNKAKIVGTNTYGKGTMQTTRVFGDNTAFKYTFRYYCPPYSDNYDGVGIAPDVVVDLSEEHQNVSSYSLSDTEDEQICAAYSELIK